MLQNFIWRIGAKRDASFIVISKGIPQNLVFICGANRLTGSLLKSGEFIGLKKAMFKKHMGHENIHKDTWGQTDIYGMCFKNWCLEF